jgi:hypothetical protein
LLTNELSLINFEGGSDGDVRSLVESGDSATKGWSHNVIGSVATLDIERRLGWCCDETTAGGIQMAAV